MAAPYLQTSFYMAKKIATPHSEVITSELIQTHTTANSTKTLNR